MFLGFNTVRAADGGESTVHGFECPYPGFLEEATNTSQSGSTVATGWGLAKACGLTEHDATPDEEHVAGFSGSDSEDEGSWHEQTHGGDHDEDWDEDHDMWEEHHHADEQPDEL